MSWRRTTPTPTTRGGANDAGLAQAHKDAAHGLDKGAARARPRGGWRRATPSPRRKPNRPGRVPAEPQRRYEGSNLCLTGRSDQEDGLRIVTARVVDKHKQAGLLGKPTRAPPPSRFRTPCLALPRSNMPWDPKNHLNRGALFRLHHSSQNPCQEGPFEKAIVVCPARLVRFSVPRPQSLQAAPSFPCSMQPSATLHSRSLACKEL